MKSFEMLLEQYAELVVKVGANVQPGQVLLMEAPLETAELTRLIVKKAYEAGAKYVQVNWDDEQVTRLRFEHAPDESFGFYPPWTVSMLEQVAESGGAVLNIKVPDPELYKGIDPEKVATASKAMAIARKTYSAYVRTNKFSWCLIKAPTRAWADKVFADVPEDERVTAMWEAIFQMNRVYAESPIGAWQEHIAQLKTVQDRMNAKAYRKLLYRAPGTDLSIELPDGHVWLGGGEYNDEGIYFVPNMPTEEVFTMPKRTGVNGTVSSTLPLNLGGRLIDGFTLTFQGGKVVAYTAKIGEEHLASLLSMDEGASYLGEVALVPHDSPISRMRRIFYNTGIDENASCHVALGSAYPVNLQGGTKLTQEELLARGGNVSLTHVDFMIGSAELDIDGELADGTVEPVMRNGNWAFE